MFFQGSIKKAIGGCRKGLVVFALLAGFTALLDAPAQAAGDGLIVKNSDFGVTKTLDRLTTVLNRKGIKVFKRVNHAKGAMSIGKDLAPIEVLIFGTPKIGTPLMKSNPMIGLDLPLKALAWKSAGGQVKIAYSDPAWLARRYGISDRDKVFKKMAGALNKFTDMASKKGGLKQK